MTGGALLHAPPRRLHVAAPVWVLGGALSTQLGAALAVKGFALVGPVGMAFGRIAFAALALGVLVRASGQPVRSVGRGRGWVVLFGVSLAVMNTCFYLALDRLPLGAAVTLEFWGPIAVAIATSRRRADLLFAALAALGVGLLGGGFGGSQPLGVAFVLAAGGAWSVYILAGRRVAAVWPGAAGLSAAMLVATVALAPLGLALAGGQLADATALGYCLGVGVLGSALPYALDQVAMRRVPARTFSVLLSLHPALAATVGVLVLGQRLSLPDALAIACVIVAAAGATRAAGAPPPEPA